MSADILILLLNQKAASLKSLVSTALILLNSLKRKNSTITKENARNAAA